MIAWLSIIWSRVKYGHLLHRLVIIGCSSRSKHRASSIKQIWNLKNWCKIRGNMREWKKNEGEIAKACWFEQIRILTGIRVFQLLISNFSSETYWKTKYILSSTEKKLAPVHIPDRYYTQYHNRIFQSLFTPINTSIFAGRFLL